MLSRILAPHFNAIADAVSNKAIDPADKEALIQKAKNIIMRLGGDPEEAPAYPNAPAPEPPAPETPDA